MGVHKTFKIGKDKEETKPLDEKTRYNTYKNIYLDLRKLKLSYSVSISILNSIIDNNNLRFDLDDTIDRVNTSWYRCKECNRILRIDKINNARYCPSQLCKMRRILVKE